MNEITKVKRMLVNKIKSNQIAKGQGVYLSKRHGGSKSKHRHDKNSENFICRSCRIMLNNRHKNEQYIHNANEGYTEPAPEDSVNKSIVRIQIK
jgi:hypothetical protein